MLAENAGHIATVKGYKKMYLLAPNYQGGKDAAAGFKRYYKGELAGEIYTQLGQPDYSAEIAEIQAAKPDGVFVFLPGGVGVNFVKQYAQAGLMGKIPLISCATDATLLPAIGDSALGLITSAPWESTVDNPTSKKFVADFTAKYKRAPSYFAALSYDAAMLIGSALKKTKGNVTDKPSFIAALKQADFKSVRGNFKFNTNHFPIADWYMFEVVKDPKTQKPTFAFRGRTLTAHKDVYADQCPLK
jgi:branched-chain amino acid transport system substrate-binding protein